MDLFWFLIRFNPDSHPTTNYTCGLYEIILWIHLNTCLLTGENMSIEILRIGVGSNAGDITNH